MVQLANDRQCTWYGSGHALWVRRTKQTSKDRHYSRESSLRSLSKCEGRLLRVFVYYIMRICHVRCRGSGRRIRNRQFRPFSRSSSVRFKHTERVQKSQPAGVAVIVISDLFLETTGEAPRESLSPPTSFSCEASTVVPACVPCCFLRVSSAPCCTSDEPDVDVVAVVFVALERCTSSHS